MLLFIVIVIKGKQSVYKCSAISVPVEHVRLAQPPVEEITVEENQATAFTCTTSIERPRSTILWYIAVGEDHATLLPGGSVSPTNNDTLTSSVGSITYSFKRSQNGSNIYCTASNTDGRTMVSSNKMLIHVLYNCKLTFISTYITAFVCMILAGNSFHFWKFCITKFEMIGLLNVTTTPKSKHIQAQLVMFSSLNQ